MTDERTAQFVYQRIQTGAACCYCCDVPILTQRIMLSQNVCLSVCPFVRNRPVSVKTAKRIVEIFDSTIILVLS